MRDEIALCLSKLDAVNGQVFSEVVQLIATDLVRLHLIAFKGFFDSMLIYSTCLPLLIIEFVAGLMIDYC